MNQVPLNGLLVLRVAQDEYGTDYLFQSVQDLFAIGHPANWVRHLEFLPRQYEEQMLGRGAKCIGPIFGPRWHKSGLLLPDTSEVARLPKLVMGAEDYNHIRKNLYGWNVFQGYTRLDCNLEKVSDEVPVIVITKEAADWLPGREGWSAFRNLVRNPVAYGGQLIGKGSEGVVYAVTWAGQPYALKVLNRQAQERLERFTEKQFMSHFTPTFPKPNFLMRVGFLPRVMEVIRDIQDLPFDILGARDYAFGHQFHLMELIPHAVTLGTLLPSETQRTRKHIAFTRKYSISDEELIAAKEVLENVKKIVAAVKQAGWFKGVNLQHDMCPDNILVRGKNAETGRLQLTLIDQGQSLLTFNDPAGVLDEVYDHKAYKDGEKAYGWMKAQPAYRQFLHKYFPAGYPHKTFYA